jgi:hypothetical protein
VGPFAFLGGKLKQRTKLIIATGLMLVFTGIVINAARNNSSLMLALFGGFLVAETKDFVIDLINNLVYGESQ